MTLIYAVQVAPFSTLKYTLRVVLVTNDAFVKAR